jgi:hypothetical protein
MLKYYVGMFGIVAIALLYAFFQDPCNRRVRTDFSAKYPSYTILESSAAEGSPETVRCHISYRKPDSAQVHEDVWLYRYEDRSWKFSRIIGTPTGEQADS